MTSKKPFSMTRVTRLSARKIGVEIDGGTLPESHARRQPSKVLASSSDSEDDNEGSFEKSTYVNRTPTKQKASLNGSELNDLSPVTPPKQRKIKNHKVIHDIEVVNTPTSLFKNLILTSPVKKCTGAFVSETIKCEIEQENTNNLKKTGRAKPKRNNKIKGQNVDIIEEPPEKVKKPLSQYQQARKALHSNFPTNLPCRESEIGILKGFIEDHLEKETSGSMYVSGPPGTGKTASLNLILQEEDVAFQLQKIYINCTAIKSATAVYSRLAKDLQLKVTGKSEKDHLTVIEKYFKKKHKMILIVLDEIDQLETKNHSILYTIFEWPSRPNSRMILIGIANALDLTDRVLPRLQARCELKPKLLHFAPYSKEQIVKIFTSRLESAGVLQIFSPIALQMLAGKVAAISGDVRRALDIGRRVVELVDQNKKGEILKSVENLANDLVDNEVKDPENYNLKTVNLQEVVSILNNVYGTSQNLTDEAEDTFPLQQKIVICSLLLMLKKAKNKDITIGKLHEVYSRVCSKRNLTAVDQAEFVGLCSLIETRGIIKVSGKKEPRMHKVSLEWNECEVAEALKDKQLMSMILQDESCLGKT